MDPTLVLYVAVAAILGVLGGLWIGMSLTRKDNERLRASAYEARERALEEIAHARNRHYADGYKDGAEDSKAV